MHKKIVLLCLLCSSLGFSLPHAIGRPANWSVLGIDPRLLAFGLYASDKLQLNDGADVRAYRFGSGGDLQIGMTAWLYGYGFARGNVRIAGYSSIAGDIRYGGRWETGTNVRMFGKAAKDPNLIEQPTLAWPITPLPVGGEARTIEAGQILTLEPGSGMPTMVTVRSGGTLVLRPTGVGFFHFRSLVFNSGARVRFEWPEGRVATIPVVVRVHEEFLIDNVVMSGVGVDARAVLWQIDGNREVHLNGGTRFLGTIAAPSAKVTVASLAGIEGCIWAKSIEIHQYNTYLRFIPLTGNSTVDDLDEDGLNDMDEMRLGTDPFLADTDGDGYSDGLEVFGRGNRMGAVRSITWYSPGFTHSWGWAFDSTRRDLFNPLRRDQLLRLVWQDSEDILRGMSDLDSIWDSTLQGCRTQPRYGDVVTPNFDLVWNDSAYLDRLVQIFADPTDKPVQNAPHLARVPDYTVTLHLDVGGAGNRNLEAGMPSFGGGVLVRTGGTNTLAGPYSFDEDGDGRISHVGVHDDTDCSGNPRRTRRTNEKDSLLLRLFRGWTTDPFRDSWMVGIGVASFASPLEPSGIANPHFLVSLQGGGNKFSFVQILLHEYAHTLGLNHHGQLNGDGSSGLALLYDGAMNYAFSGTARLQRCAQFRGSSWGDTRWCGESPPVAVGGVYRNWSNPQSVWFDLTWWRNEYTPSIGVGANRMTNADDTILFEGGGPIDPRTGFRKPTWSLGPADLQLSSGQYCDVFLNAMVESDGIRRCRDRTGNTLATPVAGTPIDWNRNGVIDPDPVDIWAEQKKHFMRFPANGKTQEPVLQGFLVRRQQDHPDWNIMLLELRPFGQPASATRPFTVFSVDRGESVQGGFKW